MIEEDADDLEAVRTAIDFEAKGVTYYAELRDAVSDPKEKALLASYPGLKMSTISPSKIRRSILLILLSGSGS